MNKISSSPIGNQGSVNSPAEFDSTQDRKLAKSSKTSPAFFNAITPDFSTNQKIKNPIPGISAESNIPGNLSKKNIRSEIEKIKTSFDIQSVMRLMLETARSFSKAQKEIRKSTFDSHTGELLKSAKEMQKSADFKMYAGLIQGGTQAIMGAVQVGISAKAATESNKGIDPQKEASKFNNKAIDFDTKANVLSDQVKQLRAETSIADSPKATITSIEEPIQTTTSTQDNANSLKTSEELATQQTEITQKNAITAEDKVIAERNSENKTAQTAESIADLEAKESAQAAESGTHKGTYEKDDIINLEIETATTTAQKIEKLENEINEARLNSEASKLQASELQKDVDKANSLANNWKSRGEIGGKIVDSLTQTGATYEKHLADDADVEARKHDAQAKTQESKSSEASDAVREADEAKRKILETLEAMNRADLETNRSIIG